MTFFFHAVAPIVLLRFYRGFYRGSIEVFQAYVNVSFFHKILMLYFERENSIDKNLVRQCHSERLWGLWKTQL
jgi:hypothetical protein